MMKRCPECGVPFDELPRVKCPTHRLALVGSLLRNRLALSSGIVTLSLPFDGAQMLHDLVNKHIASVALKEGRKQMNKCENLHTAAELAFDEMATVLQDICDPRRRANDEEWIDRRSQSLAKAAHNLKCALNLYREEESKT